MERTFRFLKFKVYKDAKKHYLKIVRITKRFPREYWSLGDQLRRNGLSVCLNVAEGS